MVVDSRAGRSPLSTDTSAAVTVVDGISIEGTDAVKLFVENFDKAYNKAAREATA